MKFNLSEKQYCISQYVNKVVDKKKWNNLGAVDPEFRFLIEEKK